MNPHIIYFQFFKSAFLSIVYFNSKYNFKKKNSSTTKTLVVLTIVILPGGKEGGGVGEENILKRTWSWFLRKIV